MLEAMEQTAQFGTVIGLTFLCLRPNGPRVFRIGSFRAVETKRLAVPG
jgi:hypothetical protein